MKPVDIRMCPNCMHIMARAFCNDCPGDPNEGLGPQTTVAVRWNSPLNGWEADL